MTIPAARPVAKQCAIVLAFTSRETYRLHPPYHRMSSSNIGQRPVERQSLGRLTFNYDRASLQSD